jgi:hypothetical protein
LRSTGIYKPTHNEALLEAYASCPPSARIFYTLELWRPSFAQAARVANVGDDIMLGIEVGALRDADAMAFVACPFQAVGRGGRAIAGISPAMSSASCSAASCRTSPCRPTRPALRQSGWKKLTFYEPLTAGCIALA